MFIKPLSLLKSVLRNNVHLNSKTSYCALDKSYKPNGMPNVTASSHREGHEFWNM